MRRWAPTLVAVVALAGTGAGTAAATTPTVPEDSTPATIADPVLSQATTDWLRAVPDWLAEPSRVPDDAFDDAFLAEVSADEVRAALATLGGGSWTLRDIQPLTETAGVAEVQGPNRRLVVQLETSADGLISTLLFENAGLTELPADRATLIEDLEAAGERTGLVLAEIDPDGTCAPVVDVRADEILPVASTFKLYVLGAVADAITAGTITWDQPVATGEDGDTVRDVAQRMIEISDNAATDHLIDLVGRDAVEAALATYGHHDPAATVPLLTTREMTILKTDPELLSRYAAADEEGRRALLADEVAARPEPTTLEGWIEPREVTSVEWFASPMDLCRVLVALDDAAAQPDLAPVGEILSANPGLAFDPAVFTELRFKGGSEPGVLVGAWLAVRPDGSRVVAAGGAASTTHDIDPAVIELVGAALTVPA